MREILYRHLSSPDLRKRDFLLTEFTEEEGVTTRVEKHYTYYVRRCQGAASAPQPTDQVTLDEQPEIPRQIFVRKTRDSQTGLEQFSYKILGRFTAAVGTRRFSVAYRHILTMEVVGDSTP